MFELISFFIALIILTLAIIYAVKNKNNMSKWISCVLLGVFFATFFLVLPTVWIKEGKMVESPVFYNILSSLLYSFKALGGRQDISQVETIALSGILKTVYVYINYILYALAPILASSLLLSFIGDTGEKIRYFFKWSKKCYVFSEINNDSIALAKSIKKSENKKTIVFCNAKNANKDLLTNAKKLGAITLFKSCKDIPLYKRFKEYEICLISENEDNNIELTEEFIAKKEKLKNHKITINSFAQSGTNIKVMESMVSKKQCAVFESTNELLIDKAKYIINTAPKTKIIFFNVQKSDIEFKKFAEDNSIECYETDWRTTELESSYNSYDFTLYYPKEIPNKKGKYKAADKGLSFVKNHLTTEWQDEKLKIRFIDEIALFCNNLLFNHPLYDLPDGKKDIFVLLVGCGRLGTQMLKTVAWCGQIKGYTLKIRVLDKKAKQIEKEFYSQYPEMKNYNVKFEEVDIEGSDFETKVSRYKNTTFVCVATGSDDLNISTAENLFEIFRRNYTGYTPPIFTRVRKVMKSDNFADKGTFLDDRNIHLFGTSNSIFSNDTLFNSELENLAFAVHLSYNWAIDDEKTSFNYQKALNDFYTSEYSRRSSMAAALHITSKLKMCNIEVKKGELPNEENLIEFDNIIKDEDKKLELMINEHERWNAFMRSEGFRTVKFSTVKKYAPLTRSHKDEDAKLHPCIISWEDLEPLQKEYDALQKKLSLKISNFKEYDEKLVVEIPKIIKRANEFSKEGW